ncbi:MupA/Atu3671 family FMN-dependent luciferase-like monooxygenase [Marivita sp. GX14005]|uniref:MupA/Atu3671 family FMN-dependent luciferase-like monooxygenase n=1 Tax=Marivita sp. GX14005 TaxID=2942276 RepID=UPI002019C8DC|nr:MupA/Atu3671 family FMN-dependent luciferase-like monooxygenase [Marivita sp. GX14005]MCL3881768.1 LLM class flavin-dependent oxidoreductase [Marivita sp. GX14005]
MTSLDCIIIGDESLTLQCAETLLARRHRLRAFVTDNPDLLRWAETRDIPVQPHGPDLADALAGSRVDWILSIANLALLPPELLKLASKGCVNFHDGPLPRRAGLNAPVWALIDGETMHGITWHVIEKGVDTGDILVTRRVEITPDDTALTLNAKCYEAGLNSFPDLLSELENGLPGRQPQDLSARSYHALKDRPEANGLLDFARSADTALRLVRALDHGPYWNPLCTPKLLLGTKIVHIGSARKRASSAAPGTVIDLDRNSLTVAFADGALRLSDLRGTTGQAIDPRGLVDLGQRLSGPDQTARDRISEVFRGLAGKDAFWRRQLAQVRPVALPLKSGGGAGLKTEPLVVPAEHLAPALCILAEHLSPGPDVGLAFTNRTIRQSETYGLAADWVPVRADHLQDGWPEIRTGFAADLIVRDPALHSFETPALGLSDDAGAICECAITVERKEGHIVAHIDESRVSTEFAEIVLRRLRWIADQLADGKRPDAIDPLPPGERRKVIETCNATERAIDGPQTMHAAFEAQVAKTPNAVALVHQNMALSYAALNERANRIAHVLRDLGVAPEEIVGLHCRREPDMIAAALGVLKAGAAYLPLDPDYPADRLAHYLKDSGARIVLTQSGIEHDLSVDIAERISLDRDSRLQNAATGDPITEASDENLAYVIYTSGSTGTPKGVMVEHRNVMNFYAAMDDVVQPEPEAAWLALTSPSFDISVLELFYTMARGIKVVLSDSNQRDTLSRRAVRQAGTGMEFSIYYWGNDDGIGRDKYRLLLDGARFADENGFCAVWTPERHFHAFGGPYPNPSVTGAAVASVTRNIGVRAGSCVAPLHHPARIAEEWAVIDNLTNGRAGIGLASGWQPDDFILRPENTPPANKPAMFDTLATIRKLWRGEPVAFPRGDGTMHEVITQPRPVSPELPVWVTIAGNPETWREAGRHGAHVLTHLLGQSIAEVEQKIGLYRQSLRDAGHDPDAFKVTLMLHTCLAETREAARDLAREPMKAYLRSAAGLIKEYAWTFPAFKKPEGVKSAFELDLGDLGEDELDSILEFAFERYFNESGLFGTIEDALARTQQLKRIGVSEIACLIDYGIPADQVLDGLKPLAEVVRLSRTEEREETDFSLAAMLERHKITHLQCTPSMARMILMDDDTRTRLRGVKHIMLGGEALPGTLVADLAEVTDASLSNMYGPTETTIWSSCCEADASEQVVSIGRPIVNTQLYVLNDAMAPLGFGEKGELWIGGAGVVRGYLHREGLTSERFRPNPFGAGRIYRTGDLVQRETDGSLNFLGRADTQIKLRGYRIELGEIETELRKSEGITDAVVLAREDVPGDMRLVAYITGQGEIDPQSLRTALAARLPDHMVPARFVMLDRFPMTPNQKIDRAALPAPGAVPVRKAPVETAPVADGIADADLRSQVADVWSEVLGVPDIPPDANFFALGGHSLLAVQAHRILKSRLDLEQLSITDIFQFPTLQALSDKIARFGARPEAQKVARIEEASPKDRARQRADAMARRRAMRARRPA